MTAICRKDLRTAMGCSGTYHKISAENHKRLLTRKSPSWLHQAPQAKSQHNQIHMLRNATSSSGNIACSKNLQNLFFVQYHKETTGIQEKVTLPPKLRLPSLSRQWSKIRDQSSGQEPSRGHL